MTFDINGRSQLEIVSRETSERLVEFQALVKKWNPAINLVSRADLPHLWDRHIMDSVQVFDMMPPKAATWCDLGSGGGFPGLVVAILAKEMAPTLRTILIESDKRKSVFLRQVSSELGLNTQVISDRIDDVPAQMADVVSARALAPLSVLCGFAVRHMTPEGIAVFPKGAGAADEIETARKLWSFDLTTVNSRTDALASILILRDIHHV